MLARSQETISSKARCCLRVCSFASTCFKAGKILESKSSSSVALSALGAFKTQNGCHCEEFQAKH